MLIFLSLNIYYKTKFNCVKPNMSFFRYQNTDVEFLCNLTSDSHIPSNNVSRITHTRHIIMDVSFLITISRVMSKVHIC